jgi:ribonuclease HI
VVFDATVDPPERLASVSEFIGITTNNVAEYKALIAGLEAVAHLHARVIHVRADSMLVINQLRGRWKVKHENMRPLHAEARALLAAYEVVDLQHVRREANTEADALVNAALDAR